MIIRKQIIPNFFTGLNFIFGLYSLLIVTNSQESNVIMLFISDNPFVFASWILLWSVNLDKMDGLTARLMNASSDFGAEFDSLADLLTFGVAPSFLIFYYVKTMHTDWFLNHQPMMFVSLVMYSICTAMRLARFNSKEDDKLSKVFFTGLPSTVGGGIIAIVVILFDKYQLFLISEVMITFLPGLLILLGLMMISPFLLPKFARRKNILLNFVQSMLAGLGYIFSFVMIFPEYLFVMIMTYLCIGFGYGLIKKSIIDQDFIE